MTTLQRIGRRFWSETAGETYCSSFLDFRLFGYVIFSGPDPAENDWPITFFTWESHKMEIVGGAFSALEGSRPGSRRRVSGANSGSFIDQLDLRQDGSLLGVDIPYRNEANQTSLLDLFFNRTGDRLISTARELLKLSGELSGLVRRPAASIEMRPDESV